MAKLKKIHSRSAGIDIGSEKNFVAVEGNGVKNFKTFTESFIETVKYLQQEKVTTVAMEATGVYWVTLYDMLERSGIEVYVVNASDVKNVPGRKSDVQDCQWIQQLHSYGLLKKCFIPEDKIRQLRSYVRLREDYIQMGATHVQHMQKALILMNIKLHQVISQINGVSGLKVIHAILEGERDAIKLADLCDKQILKHKREDVIKSLRGNYKTDQIFCLRQAHKSWKFYQDQIQECDIEINKILDEMTTGKTIPKNINKPKAIRHNKPKIDKLHEKLMTITEGNDVTMLPGITDYNLMQIIAETGTDFTKWQTGKHFTSWMGLSPGKNTSGKNTKRSKKRINTKTGQLFKEAARTLLKSKYIGLGAFARRLRAKKGAPIAIKATARKLALMFYNIMTKGTAFVEEGIKKYEKQYMETLMKSLNRRAKELNLQLMPIT